MIARPPRTVPVPAALVNVFPSPPQTPAEAADRAGVLLVAQAGTCQDPDAREHGRHLRAAEISRANKQLARTRPVYSWANLPGRKQKEYR
ncbi:hypothetical protein [Streptomyces sp. NPDC056105]|uniref:hypothetical protein n=1 Tax=Streptomyces sp. NPDC056105 TaxID=3345714 RepID=UPI0035DAF0EC